MTYNKTKDICLTRIVLCVRKYIISFSNNLLGITNLLGSRRVISIRISQDKVNGISRKQF